MTTTIQGPKVQMPSAMAAWFTTDGQGNITGLTQDAAQFLHALEGLANADTRSGPTAARPTRTMQWRYVGMPYFDTDLGKTVFLKTPSTTDVWVDATGAVV